MAAWHELFPLDREPTMEDIAGYIDHPLWDAFTAFVDERLRRETAHRVQPMRRRSGLEREVQGARPRAVHGISARRLLHLHGVGGLEGEG